LDKIHEQFGQLHEIALGFASVANGLQASVLELLVKFDAAAADTTRSARKAVVISVTATVLTLLGVVVPVAYAEFWQAPAEAAASKAMIDDLEEQLASIRESQHATAEQLATALENLASAETQASSELSKALREHADTPTLSRSGSPR
jgi:DNA anti-recombination protein RmuC